MAGQSEPAAASGYDELGGGGEQSQAQAFGFPAPDRSVQGEHGHPGQQLQGELDGLQPDAVLCGVVQRQVPQAGVTGGADAVLSPGPLTMPQLQGRDRDAGGVRREARDAHDVGVGDPQGGQPGGSPR